MPLLDHFRPPISQQHSWESFHSNWATRLADLLNEALPPEFLAEEQTHAGRLEIDVATYETGPSAHSNGVVLLEPKTWAPSVATATIPLVFPDTFEVRIFHTNDGMTLVAVIELISPSKKDRPEERKAFATKAASYLHQGVSLILVDVVTSRSGNLHNDTLDRFSSGADGRFPKSVELYASAFQPQLRGDAAEVDLWLAPLKLGDTLPTLPLRLTGDLFVPVDLEASYSEACVRRRIA